MVEPLVAIRCITYNHEPYIRDALEGFVIQQTDFPFIAIVHDDASTDKTADIIREYAEKYPNIIKPIYETENQYSKQGNPLGKIMQDAIDRSGAKYIAICEGDDYWIDPLKLQKQVDFLESHPDYGMCYTRVKRYDQKKNEFKTEFGGVNETLDSLIVNNTIPTLTTVIRTNLIRSYTQEIKPETRNWLMGDYPKWLYIAANSKIKFFPEVTGVYRILNNSASHHTNSVNQLKFTLSYFKISEYFANKYDSKKIGQIKEVINWINYQLLICTSEKRSYKRDSLKFLLHAKKIKYIAFIIISIILPEHFVRKAVERKRANRN